jgi:hypothetical protein
MTARASAASTGRDGRNTLPAANDGPSAMPAFGGDVAQEFFGPLQQQAAAVAGFAVGPDGAAMGHAFERGQRGVDEFARRRVVEVRDQPETAAVVLEAGVIQALLSIVAHVVRP